MLDVLEFVFRERCYYRNRIILPYSFAAKSFAKVDTKTITLLFLIVGGIILHFFNFSPLTALYSDPSHFSKLWAFTITKIF